MSRPVKIIILTIIIALIGAFDLFRLEFRAPHTTYFNEVFRYRFARYPAARSIFHLKDYGDDRADYLGSKYGSILIEVHKMAGGELSQQVMDDLAQKIKNATGKSTSYAVYEDLPYQAQVDDNTIATFFNSYARQNTAPNTAVVYLFVLSQEPDQPDLIGTTYQANGLVVFDSAIANFTANVPYTFSSYQLSTALHEFGHQLGLEHNDVPNCLMNAKAENAGTPRLSAADVVTDFCPLEVDQIRHMLY